MAKKTYRKYKCTQIGVIKTALMQGMGAEFTISKGDKKALLILEAHPDKPALYPVLNDNPDFGESHSEDWEHIMKEINKHSSFDEFSSHNLLNTPDEACDWLDFVKRHGFKIGKQRNGD